MSVVSILFCIVLGSACFYGYYNIGKDNNIIKTWPKTSGKILKTDIIPGRSATLQLKYEYFVNGVRYESGNIYRNYNRGYGLGGSYNLDELEFLKNPEVKYNPENPTDCCLLLWYDKLWLKIVLILAGVVLSLFGWGGLLVKILN